jgi:hypothetical protein
VRQGGKAESNKLAVRVHEVDGAHDHLLDLEEDLFGTDLPCYSRLRKNRRKKGQPGEGPEVISKHCLSVFKAAASANLWRACVMRELRRERTRSPT